MRNDRGRSSSGGRFHTGGRGSGRGCGRFNGRPKKHNGATKNTSISDEKLFALHHPGKPQKVTHDSLKEHLLLQMQMKLKNGSDIADALREGDITFKALTKPTRQAKKATKTIVEDSMQCANLQAERAGCDLLHAEEKSGCAMPGCQHMRTT